MGAPDAQFTGVLSQHQFVAPIQLSPFPNGDLLTRVGDAVKSGDIGRSFTAAAFI
tara:strand:+ start:1219 stop:1383 length:165 start_codon:yes stop_codon:yes gene_type:complete